MAQVLLSPGQKVFHRDFGEGIVTAIPPDGYVRVFFPTGEKQIHPDALQIPQSRIEQIIEGVSPGADRLRNAWLHIEAHALPLMGNAAALTSARIDLLPHQVVITHRIATASPRRFLIADEVGLGKTIEVALVLRELASRGELNRALMIVPAGLVNNWHRELNQVFNLNFEVFGSEGDVTDRKSNAFAKHDRLIASIDTMKRPERIKRLRDAPPWDLVVFDEAHHLSAYRNGTKVRKTENYKLAEAIRSHTRDLLLLSATPHQGDHFRFWMLIQLLNPTLFANPDDMVEQRYRLNTAVFRRTKADACTPDGSPLFARRWVHTESFVMNDGERLFYNQLREYLQDGFDLAKRQGNQGRALGFIMTIFQKIAASSFAAVRSTLRRRQLMLTIYEAIVKDQSLDIDGHLELLNEARRLIMVENKLPGDPIGKGEADHILADLKLRLLKKLENEDLFIFASSDSSEFQSAQGEELAALSIANTLPQERLRIAELLAVFPAQQEIKVEKLLRGLGSLWNQNPNEKIVIFATYLATVDLLSREIETAYPGQGVVVLRGGDHGTKLAAERRFRKADGPRVLICTAAGREGINLQFARILFNFDLPWNPMDVEQRIGRIHRYGQKDTAQVYNLVLSDTIEGRIYLMLTDKLVEIARALGKVDEHGNVTEDLRVQILGQLSERLSYDQLYRDALTDPELRRTRQEVDSALSNAKEARKVVVELFQDLDKFSLDDYAPLADVEQSKIRIMNFLRQSLVSENGDLQTIDNRRFLVSSPNIPTPMKCTLDRDLVQEEDNLILLGIDHPLMVRFISQWRSMPPNFLGSTAVMGSTTPAIMTTWFVQSFGKPSETGSYLIPLVIDLEGKRIPSIEKQFQNCFSAAPGKPVCQPKERKRILGEIIEPMLRRELSHRGISGPEKSYSTELLAWVELS